MDKDSVLNEIFSNDPLGLLDTKSRPSGIKTEDERLIASFEEINEYVDKSKSQPQKNMGNMQEMKLFSRLKGLRKNLENIKVLEEYDRHGLLKIKEEIEVNSIDDIFEGDAFGLLEDAEDIFTLKHVPNEIDMPEYRAKQKTCKEFDKYEHLFQECYRDLASGKRNSLPFAKEQDIEQDSFFILKGVMLYVAHKGKKEKSKGKTNARLHCIYENGTESDLLLRSLSRELYRNGRRITEHEDRILSKLSGITKEDEATGFIYILKSKSDDEKIRSLTNLYKIGFSKVDVKERIKNAEKEPTYLMAPVSLVSAFECYNMNPQKFEQLLHKFFGRACLNIDIFDKNGDRHTPREWFVAPLNIIEQAIESILTGDILNYRYDNDTEQIVSR